MKKVYILLLTISLFSCSEINKTSNSKIFLEKVKSKSETEFQNLLTSVNKYKLEPNDSLSNLFDFNETQLEKLKIGGNNIEIYRKDKYNINWIKINSLKFLINDLKSINKRTDGGDNTMFCNALKKIKLYKYKRNELIFMEFTSHLCTGLGCSVTDYLIFDVKNKSLSLFGSFRSSNFDLYDFPIDPEINYIASHYEGDFQGGTSMHFINNVYSMDAKGGFYITLDKNKKNLFYETITYPNDTLKDEFDYKWNWF